MDYPNLNNAHGVALDVEATGLCWWKDSIFGFSITTDEFSRYWDIRKDPGALRWLADCAPTWKSWGAHNTKYEIHMCREAGVNLPVETAWDTMIEAALLDEHRMSYDLDSIAYDEVGEWKEDIWAELAAMFGGKATKDAQILNLVNAPPDLVGRYANQDSRLCRMVHEKHVPKMEAEDLMRVYGVEIDLLEVLADIEHHGVRVDIARAERSVDELSEQIIIQQKELDTLAGFPINVNPSNSIHKLFAPKLIADGKFQANDGTLLKTTDGGKPSFDAETLRAMVHPAAARILQLRQTRAVKEKFLMVHVLGHHHNGVVHANFNQAKSENELGTGTGRLSCNEPALQQIPKRNKIIAAIVRACFIPDSDQDWTCHDWRQMDFRVFAHYVAVPQVLAAYAANPLLDYHKMVADLTKLPRTQTVGIKGNAKQINLGLVFGMGPGKLAQEMGLPFTVEPNAYRPGKVWVKPGPEAEAVFDQYHKNVPGVKGFLEQASRIAKNRGYVRTMLGRRIRFPHGQFTHKAGGLVFQGTAADALKRKLYETWRYLRGTNGRLLLNVHDEADTSLPKGSEGEKLSAGITEILQDFDKDTSFMRFKVPIRADVGVGPNWHEASKE